MSEINNSSVLLTDDIKNKLDLKIVGALFNILYKKDLISKKELNLLIAQLNNKLQEDPK